VKREGLGRARRREKWNRLSSMVHGSRHLGRAVFLFTVATHLKTELPLSDSLPVTSFMSLSCTSWTHENKCGLTITNTASHSNKHCKHQAREKARVCLCAHVLCASAVRAHRAHTHNCSGRGSAAVARAAVRTCDTSPVVGRVREVRWSLHEARGPGQATDKRG
jgi:hypothetical protein